MKVPTFPVKIELPKGVSWDTMKKLNEALDRKMSNDGDKYSKMMSEAQQKILEELHGVELNENRVYTDNDSEVDKKDKIIAQAREIIEAQRKIIEGVYDDQDVIAIPEELIYFHNGSECKIETEKIMHPKGVEWEEIKKKTLSDFYDESEKSIKEMPLGQKEYYGDTACAEAMESMSETEAIAFYKLSAFKYLWRLGRKPNASVGVDLEKIQWYINRIKEVCES